MKSIGYGAYGSFTGNQLGCGGKECSCGCSKKPSTGLGGCGCNKPKNVNWMKGRMMGYGLGSLDLKHPVLAKVAIVAAVLLAGWVYWNQD